MALLKYFAGLRLSRFFKIFFVLWDVLILNVAIVFSLWWRYGNLARIDLKEVRTISLISVVSWVFILFSKEVFRMVRYEKIEKILSRMCQQLLLHATLIAFFVTALKFQDISRLRLLYFYGSFFILLFISRILMMRVLKRIRSRGYNFKTVVMVGANDIGERMNRILSKDLSYGYRVLGFFDDAKAEMKLSAPLLGKFEELEPFLCTHKVDELFVALPIGQVAVIKKVTALCERYMVRIRYVPDFQQYTQSKRVQISFYGNGNVPVLMFRKEPLESPLHCIMKKVFDFCFSIVVIVFVFSWLFPILMLIIKLNSPGPIFFVQERSGRDNKAFPCFKFRTMVVNATADQQQASKNDARITRVGAFLRKTSLDELPQFFNVLLGNMSVVGPRPHMLSHTEQYSELINNFLVRHYAKPGITGWAQVNGFRGETKALSDMEGRVEHDIWYIENWSLLLDIKIIWKTSMQVFKGDPHAF